MPARSTSTCPCLELMYGCRCVRGAYRPFVLRLRSNAGFSLQQPVLSRHCQRVKAARAASTSHAACDSENNSSSGPDTRFKFPDNAENQLSAIQLQQAKTYIKILLEQNNTMNLTGAANEEEAYQMHIEDSLALLPALDAFAQQRLSKQQGAAAQYSIIDVGSGGGLPGVILAIARPDWKVTLLDSLRKRCSFVEMAVREVGVQNTEVVWARAEEAGQSQQHREVYDVAVARAVAKMRVLAELCLPFVKPGGHWLAAKGPDCQEEVAAAENAISTLQGSVPSITAVNAFGSAGQHMAVVVKKLAATPLQYPRQAGKPNKRPP